MLEFFKQVKDLGYTHPQLTLRAEPGALVMDFRADEPGNKTRVTSQVMLAENVINHAVVDILAPTLKELHSQLSKSR